MLFCFMSFALLDRSKEYCYNLLIQYSVCVFLLEFCSSSFTHLLLHSNWPLWLAPKNFLCGVSDISNEPRLVSWLPPLLLPKSVWISGPCLVQFSVKQSKWFSQCYRLKWWGQRTELVDSKRITRSPVYKDSVANLCKIAVTFFC